MKIYLVVETSNEGRSVVGVFTDRKKAFDKAETLTATHTKVNSVLIEQWSDDLVGLREVVYDQQGRKYANWKY